MRLIVKKLSETALLPTKAHEDDVGYDLYADGDFILPPGKVTKISTGIAYGGIGPRFLLEKAFKDVFPKIEGRSGLASNGVFPVGGIVDPGYRGELVVMLYNSNDEIFPIKKGNKIAQLVFYATGQPDIVIGELEKTSRGESGFGSSGS